MGVLTGLKPEAVFQYFEEICGIPHTSHHEKALSDHCVKFAKDRGYACTQDEMGNVIIIAEATPGYEDVPAVIIQGHLDMVGDKAEGCDIDMEKEGPRIYIDGDFIRADGTTLGGDNGIAVAYALALLDAEKGSIPHPRMEVVLTVCEEVGLLGASAMDFYPCRARRMINIDSEVEGILTAGCAGGRRARCHIPVKRTHCSGLRCKLELTGLMGGHSGMEIDKGRSNAAALLGRFLMFLKENIPYNLVTLTAGVKENVIPKSGSAVILIPPEEEEALRRALERFMRYMGAEYGKADPDIRLELMVGKAGEFPALDEDSRLRVLTALNLMPNGVQAMSMDLPGLVETSINLGVAELSDDELILRQSIRSSVSSAKEMVSRKVTLLAEQLGGRVDFQGDYPAWPYARTSKLRDLCVKIFKEQYGYEPKIELMHAGLECGILSGKLDGLDCISFGPNQFDIHTPNEHLSISSAARVWEYLKAILAAK
ncbi:MAG: aminoacyl-histidine dipeptidase [Lachnospiraceae bacterium]|jgi:dipeptidase D|nr:aminoacyl-histidine dipeptidase [Lachnospiraceae bacterium]